MSKLSLRYKYDANFFDPTMPPDDFGYLSIDACTDSFSGQGGFWAQWQDVKEFGEALGRFPTKPDAPVAMGLGYNMQEGDDLILRIEIAAADDHGTVIVRFEIANDDEPNDRVRASFQTDYSDLDAFRLSIAALMNSEVDEAVLMGR